MDTVGYIADITDIVEITDLIGIKDIRVDIGAGT
jgi:hypothetical protein